MNAPSAAASGSAQAGTSTPSAPMYRSGGSLIARLFGLGPILTLALLIGLLTLQALLPQLLIRVAIGTRSVGAGLALNGLPLEPFVHLARAADTAARALEPFTLSRATFWQAWSSFDGLGAWGLLPLHLLSVADALPIGHAPALAALAVLVADTIGVILSMLIASAFLGRPWRARDQIVRVALAIPIAWIGFSALYLAGVKLAQVLAAG